MAYLDDHPPVRDQWFPKRRRALTGCTVLHTSESVMDTVGPDTGAETVAEFIRRRTTPGSYHHLVDSDSVINVVALDHGAYHDGTGSNNWALSISFACRTSDWARMSPDKRRAFLRQGALAFAAQQAYRRAHGFPLTELRLITKAQSDRGESGITYHGLRDPGRRSDPGVAKPYLFPIDEFITECHAVMAGTTTEEDFMAKLSEQEQRDLYGAVDRINRQLIDEQASRRWMSGNSVEDYVVYERPADIPAGVNAWPCRPADVGDVIGLIRLVQHGDYAVLTEISSAFHQEAARDAAAHAALRAQIASQTKPAK